jgi:hypothetical protein
MMKMWLGALLLLGNIPVVAAVGLNEGPFPDISFHEFSDFVKMNFSSTISLSSVLLILFSLTENVQLLSLHGRQQKKRYREERSTTVTAWIRVLAQSIRQKLEADIDSVLNEDMPNRMQEEQITIAVAMKLNSMATLLRLYPFNKAGKFTGKLKPVSYEAIEPIHVVCPDAVVCQTMTCKPRSLLMTSKPRDIPYVTLIKGFKAYENVPVLAGSCDTCKTIYYADHERSPSGIMGHADRVYLNSAKYIKIGHSMWVDRPFTSAVLSGVYNFHASTAAYTEFWNSAFCVSQNSDVGKVSRRHIWQAFVQESIRMLGSMSDLNLTLRDNLPVEEVTKEAFHVLGERGIIRAADGHSCKECTQKYRTSETLSSSESEYDDVDNIRAPVKMVVVDGIVIGHAICAYPDCTSALLNAHGGVYCALHEDLFGTQCHVSGCTDDKVQSTLACQAHQVRWQRFLRNHQAKHLSGYRRALRHADDSWPWMPQMQTNQQPHDQEVVDNRGRDQFIPSRTYCVETICAPCGVVIAWAKFAKAESPTNILNFLEQVYPTEISRPDYICIDKACLVMRTSINNGSWEQTWSRTSRFIVDSYHYTNHSINDNLCHRWCNPTPRDGSAPNLVVAGRTRDGQTYKKSAFNTQACEQLNAWLGGFDSILRRMTPGNFNWFLHTMLTYHTTQVCKKLAKAQVHTDDDSSEGSN